jgi:hypothetical protein
LLPSAATTTPAATAMLCWTVDCGYTDQRPSRIFTPDCFQVPRLLWCALFPFQRTGLRWFWGLHCRSHGGILADDMGLGKTVQACAFLASLVYAMLRCCRLLLSLLTLLKLLWTRWPDARRLSCDADMAVD